MISKERIEEILTNLDRDIDFENLKNADSTLIDILVGGIAQNISGFIDLNVFIGSVGMAYALGRSRGRKDAAMGALLSAEVTSEE